MRDLNKDFSDAYALVVLDGASVTVGQLSLCDLSNHYQRDRIRYQVHCDQHDIKFSQVYDSLDEALAKFIELRKKVKIV